MVYKIFNWEIGVPKSLTVVECEALDITFPCERMDNGEFRFRLMDKGQNSGWGYILTKIPESYSGWQNSHYHIGVMETIIIQKGWIGFAELLPDGKMTVRVYRPGDVFTTKPGHAHNVYMPADAVVHAVKHGDCSLEKDWFASPALDEKTKHLSEIDIFWFAGESRDTS